MAAVTRPSALARIAVGAACLAAPARLLTALGSPDADDTETRLVARVLGVRYVAQAALQLWGPPLVRRVGPAVELTHAASMLPLAIRSPRHRRSASASAVTALAIGLIDLVGRR